MQTLARCRMNPAEQGMHVPEFFRRSREEDRRRLAELLQSAHPPFCRDTIYDQLKELMKNRYPDQKLTAHQYETFIVQHLNGCELEDYGVWVHYPWSRELVHLLDEEEFIEVRTARNLYKITRKEQQSLRQRKIGITGLSVGQSIALTLATERICGELRLADFDHLELGNMNRIRTSVRNIGVLKVVIAAREIAEIDPFIKVVCLHEGLTEQNMDRFFLEDGKLDLYVEECDGLDIKILSRLRARELQIPVLMDTNDRGMLDVERFDLEPQRPVLHGLTRDLKPENLVNISPARKVEVVLQMLGEDQISPRCIASMIEVGKTITSWPQLASSVTLGAAMVTDVARRILLGQFTASGRYYVDLEEIICKKDIRKPVRETYPNPFKPLETDEILQKVTLHRKSSPIPYHQLSDFYLDQLITAAIAAPSTGNNQPWRWHYEAGYLYLFHDKSRSYSFGNFQNISAELSLGAAIENVALKASRLGLHARIRYFPIAGDDALVAVFSFSMNGADPVTQKRNASLADYIELRCTNRHVTGYQLLDPENLRILAAEISVIPGAQIQWLTSREEIRSAAGLVAACDRIRFLNKHCHHDLFNRELRWDRVGDATFEDGLPISTLSLTPAQHSAMKVIQNGRVIDHLIEIDGGKAFEDDTFDSLKVASAIGLITIERADGHPYLNGGRAFERMWLKATALRIAVQPFMSPIFFFPRILRGAGSGFLPSHEAELVQLHQRFRSLFQLNETRTEVFLFKIFLSQNKVARAPRRHPDQILTRP